ncbi:MAG: enolase C-terminal domain-like protein [Planctomycetota bacterium]
MTLVLCLCVLGASPRASADYVIQRVDLEQFDIPLRTAFQTAKATSTSCYGILVTVHAVDEASGRRVRGIGTILPRSLVTNEIRRDAWAASGKLAESIRGARLTGVDRAADLAAVDTLVRSLSDAANAFTLTTKYPPAKDRQLRATVCGFDIALLDLLGQLHDRPIWALLNPDSKRTHIKRSAPTYGTGTGSASLSRRVPAAHAAYDAIRMKIGTDLEEDPERVGAVAEALVAAGRMDTAIWVDVNQAWKSPEASADQLGRLADVLSQAGFTATFIVEQPTVEDDLEALRDVTHAVRGWGDRYPFRIQVMADESIWLLADVQRLVELDAADMVNIKLQKAGGLQEAMRMGRYLEAHAPDTGVYLGGLVMTDLGAWANVHASFALPRLDYQTSGAPRRNFPDNVASYPLTYAFDRSIRRPTQSGLSTAVDREALEPFIEKTRVVGQLSDRPTTPRRLP